MDHTDSQEYRDSREKEREVGRFELALPLHSRLSGRCKPDRVRAPNFHVENRPGFSWARNAGPAIVGQARFLGDSPSVTCHVGCVDHGLNIWIWSELFFVKEANGVQRLVRCVWAHSHRWATLNFVLHVSIVIFGRSVQLFVSCVAKSKKKILRLKSVWIRYLRKIQALKRKFDLYGI